MDTPTPRTDEGKLFAFLSYASIFIGFPLWIIPMVTKNDAYSLQHAKHAAGAWLIWLFSWVIVMFMMTCGGMVLGMFTFGIGSLLTLCCLPLPFLPWITMIHGFILVANDRWDAPLGAFGIGEMLFGSVKIEPPKG